MELDNPATQGQEAKRVETANLVRPVQPESPAPLAKTVPQDPLAKTDPKEAKDPMDRQALSDPPDQMERKVQMGLQEKMVNPAALDPLEKLDRYNEPFNCSKIQ